ncbi:hypothetical protein D3C84_773220 [compost metagenome]
MNLKQLTESELCDANGDILRRRSTTELRQLLVDVAAQRHDATRTARGKTKAQIGASNKPVPTSPIGRSTSASLAPARYASGPLSMPTSAARQ